MVAFSNEYICFVEHTQLKHTHFHPSSDIYPSKEDNKVAERVKRAGELMGIELLDFIIVGNGVYSYSENKVL